ncbi:MAG: protoheme IX farnesyltransferase [Planctomycetota bacterium]|nr:MAG: protoheme IX farnesyltransferase [Planctomycetota bacterium]
MKPLITAKHVNLSQHLKNLLALAKIRITSAVVFTTTIGYCLATKQFQLPLLNIILGTFLLACGSAAFNHFQDRKIDAKMNRTKQRPLPSNALTAKQVLWIALAWILLGSLTLYWQAGTLPTLLGLIAVLWYNGVYTPLKRKTPWAVIPGALIGSLPPYIGWTAGGGNLLAPPIFAFALFMFIWQIPHFWLLLLTYGKEYEKAQLPSLTTLYSSQQIAYLTFILIWILVSSNYLLIQMNTLRSIPSILLLIPLNLYLLLVSKNILQDQSPTTAKRIFQHINTYALAIFLLILWETFYLPN